MNILFRFFDEPPITIINGFPRQESMDFCPRCGRYLKDEEYQCPECGNIVRQIPRDEQVPPEMGGYSDAGRGPVSLKKAVFEKYFFIAFAIAFAASFAVTYFWRFSFLFFCIPLFIPMGRISIGLGAFAGLVGGSAVAYLYKYYLLNNLIM